MKAEYPSQLDYSGSDVHLQAGEILFGCVCVCACSLEGPMVAAGGGGVEKWRGIRETHMKEQAITSRAACAEMTPAGLEPAIPGSVGRCLIHWATGPLLRC